MLVADWLLELECEVAGTASSVKAALEIAARETLHAALLDVHLGGEDSFQLADSLIAANVPVAFITGRDSHSLPPRFQQSPVLCKPFDFSAIERLLAGMLAPAGEPSV